MPAVMALMIVAMMGVAVCWLTRAYNPLIAFLVSK
jgi:hypothetical protein